MSQDLAGLEVVLRIPAEVGRGAGEVGRERIPGEGHHQYFSNLRTQLSVVVQTYNTSSLRLKQEDHKFKSSLVYIVRHKSKNQTQYKKEPNMPHHISWLNALS
jgi:hypothetical protein